MVVEHSFITTLDAADALGATRDLLLSRNWIIKSETPTAVEATAGEANVQKAKSVHTLPQHILVEFDRGRVTLAASITPVRKADPSHSHYLVAIIEAIENHIAYNDPNCCDKWDNLVLVHEEERRKKVRRQKITLFSCLTLVILFIGFIVLMAILNK